MSVFFEMNIELLSEYSLKKLKMAQQDMIDQTKVNLGQPVKFKFNGILSKYVDGIRKRENKQKSDELIALEQSEVEQAATMADETESESMQGELNSALLPVNKQKLQIQNKQKIEELRRYQKQNTSEQIDEIVMKYIF